jgi:hypothetical protein
MKRHELEHLIRSSASLTNEYEVYIIGSQSILGACPWACGILADSNEADIFFEKDDSGRLADVVDGGIGEESPFHRTFGYYAQGVSKFTAILPEGWEGRLVRIQNKGTNDMVGFCISPSDLAASKLMAGRDKDYPFVREMIHQGMVDPVFVKTLIETINGHDERKDGALAWITAHVGNDSIETMTTSRSTDPSAALRSDTPSPD